ncbi:MAG: DUF2333 family protein [Gammaproteobacteria bacterium]|jgi:hypothetical protein
MMEDELVMEEGRRWWRWGVAAVVLLAVVLWGIGWYWSREPDPLPAPNAAAGQHVGVASTQALIDSINILLHKPGGYLRNDVMPPGVLLDNMPAWEYGALVQLRDFTHILRNEISRPQSQSLRDPDLSHAEPRLNVDSTSWAFPRSEGAYADAVRRLQSYRDRLAGRKQPEAYFYARARNMNLWLHIVSRRLGGLSRQLEAAAGQVATEDLPLNGPGAGSATREAYTRVSWWQADDVFYRARGAGWALLNLTRALEHDFHGVLVDKNALSSFRDLEHTLEASQRPMYSPVVLTGSGFGIFANHTLTMAAYLASANSTVINLENLMQQD